MTPTRTRPNRWPLALIALGLVFLGGLGFSLYWGITRTSAVSDPAYYSRGLGYGARQRAEEATRGWALQARRVPGALELAVADAGGTPVPGLAGELVLLAPDGTPGARAPLAEGAPGTYRVPLAPPPAGGVRAVVELSRPGAVLRRPLLLAP